MKNYNVYSASNKMKLGEFLGIETTNEGIKITAILDNTTVVEVEDETFSEEGMIGLWTKADAVTAFDEFEVVLTRKVF